jgi:uncharacterized protein YbjT (DUF2867 family)
VNVLVVGATGGLGQQVVLSLASAGHQAVALVRSPSTSLGSEVIQVKGDVLNPASLTDALRGQEAVICVLGTPSPRQPSTLLREGTKNVVEAMRTENISRLVCVTLLGLGPSKKNTSFFYGQLILRVLAPMIPDKEAQEDVIRQSPLAWTLVRPPRFTNGQPCGSLRTITEGGTGRLGRVVRADLARFVVECVVEGGHIGDAVGVGS